MLQVKPIWSMMGLWYQCIYGWDHIINVWVGCRILYGYTIIISYEIILCSQVSWPQSWYSNVNGDLIRWKHAWILQDNGWLNLKSYEKGHMGHSFKEVKWLSQCAFGNMVFKCKSKPDWTISKFNAWYCVRGDFQKRLSRETWTRIIRWYRGSHWGWCWFCGVF